MLKGTYNPIDYFSDDEAVDIICAADRPHWKLLFWILWETGARVGEVLGMTRKDSYFDELQIGIWLEKHKHPVYARRVVTEDLADELTRYIAKMKTRRQMLFPFDISSASKALKRAAMKAGITRNVHSHMFRHGLAFKLARELDGTETYRASIIQQALGHTTQASLGVYTQATRKDALDMVRKVIEG